MHSTALHLTFCFLLVDGFRGVFRPNNEHIGKSFQFLAAEDDEQADDGAVGEDAGWEIPEEGEDSSSVPLAMRLLLKKAESDVIWPQKTPATEDFTSIAKSLSPESIEIGTRGNLAVINFTVPNEYSRAFGKNRTTWFILTLNNVTQNLPITATLYDTHRFRANALVNSTQVDWQKKFLLFNVTKYVKYSFRNQSLSFSLILQRTGYPSKTLISVSDVVELYGFEKGPILVSTACPELFAKNMPGFLRRNKRGTRSLVSPSENATTSSQSTMPSTSTEAPITSSCDCRLQEWAPNKDELGWTWLIRPEFVPINFCIGNCPVPLLNSTFNASSNAIARDYYRTIVKARDPNLNHPDIHCVPIQYRPLAVLIESAPGIISMERVSTLTVSQCGCR